MTLVREASRQGTRQLRSFLGAAALASLRQWSCRGPWTLHLRLGAQALGQAVPSDPHPHTPELP